MRKLSRFSAVGLAALVACGAAVAAEPEKRVMDVPLPDGSTAHIEYYGDIAPKVTIDPAPAFGFPGSWMSGPIARLPNIDRIIERMNRQRSAILQQMRRIPRHRAGPGATAHVASQNGLPQGTSSVSVVSVTNGGATCTRTTRVTSQGAGKPPKVVTKVSGNCAEREGVLPDAAAEPTAALDRT